MKQEENEAIERSISNGLGFNKEALAGMEERGKEIAEIQRGRGLNNMACDISRGPASAYPREVRSNHQARGRSRERTQRRRRRESQPRRVEHPPHRRPAA